MDILAQVGVGMLSLIITLTASFAANLLPRRSPSSVVTTAAQPEAEPQRPTENFPNAGVQYGSLQSAALGKELKFAVQLPPSYEKDEKRRFPVVYFLHGMFGNEREFERRGIAAKVASIREEGKI